MSNLMDASKQWSFRPADERFATLEDLYLNCLLAYNNARTSNVLMSSLTAVAVNGDVQVKSPQGNLGFNNWSFSQFANRLGSPAGFLSDLPAELAADVLNNRIQKYAAPDSIYDAQLYYDEPSKIARAFTSQSYGRIPNHEVVDAIIKLPGKWTTPPARPATADQPGTRIATEADCKSSTLIKPGDVIAPAGLYGSDRDMFAFLVDPETRISDGTDGGLSRGFFVRNSEVGNATFSITTFLYRYVCGNHIVWGAEEVKNLSIKHSGRTARDRAIAGFSTQLKSYTESSAKADEAFIKSAKEKELGGTYDEVLELIFGQKKMLSKNKVKAAYDKANEFTDTDGSPRSVWGFAQGLTRVSQNSPYADERNLLDKAAGKILELAN